MEQQGGNISIERSRAARGARCASRASSPVVDSDAAVGGATRPRTKNGRDVVAQIGILVESKDQQSGR